MSDGSEFQVCGAATENAWRANSVLVLAADSSRVSEDRSECIAFVCTRGVSAALSAFFVCGDLYLLRLTVTFKVGRDVCTVHLTAKFHHPTLNCSEVIVLTNEQSDKQMPLNTSTSLRYSPPVDNIGNV